MLECAPWSAQGSRNLAGANPVLLIVHGNYQVLYNSIPCPLTKNTGTALLRPYSCSNTGAAARAAAGAPPPRVTEMKKRKSAIGEMMIWGSSSDFVQGASGREEGGGEEEEGRREMGPI